MQSFSEEVVSKGRLTIQKNGLYRYDADLSRIVGTKGEMGGRVILDPKTGEVITQFPQFVK